MRGCEAVYDIETAGKVQAMIEKATGRPCPCIHGKVCPLIPGDVVLVPAISVERPERPQSCKVQASLPRAQ